jgi:hypothetical protein
MLCSSLRSVRRHLENTLIYLQVLLRGQFIWGRDGYLEVCLSVHFLIVEKLAVSPGLYHIFGAILQHLR